MADQHFGAALEGLLADLDWTQAKLTRELGERGVTITDSAVAQWITGRTRPAAATLAVILQDLCQDDAQRQRLLSAVRVDGSSSFVSASS